MRLLVLLLLLLAFLVRTAPAQVEESGSLRGFLAGEEPAAAYDRWLSHVVEGVARPGYNAYAPEILDRQTTGFGAFDLPGNDAAGDSVLALFADLADLLLLGDGAAAQLRLEQGPDVDYELVAFEDVEGAGLVWLLRERLDGSFVDGNADPGPGDDEVGSFRRGWGLFAFRPAAPRPAWLVEVPHPCDDFLAGPFAVEVFLREGAGLLLLNGAGREVAYSGAPEAYTNTRSLSDPSRNGRLPFAVVHERAVSHWRTLEQRELALQMHSYDDLAHRDLESVVASSGTTLRQLQPPLLDTGGGPRGLLNRLAHPVHAADALGFAHGAVALADFVSTQSLVPVHVDGGLPGGDVEIRIAASLWGYTGNRQEDVSHPDGWPDCGQEETWLHVELDELPTIAHVLGQEAWYAAEAGQPVGPANFEAARRYFWPFVEALAEAEDSLAAGGPTAPPTAPGSLVATAVASDRVALAWTPTRSTDFASYELLVDPSGEITPAADTLRAEDFEAFCWAPLDRATVEGLAYQTPTAFALRGVDAEGRAGAWSDAATATPDDVSPPTIAALFPAGRSEFWVRPGGGELALRLRDAEHAVELASLELRWDRDGDGAYAGAEEDWLSLGLAGTPADTTLRLAPAFDVEGLHALEWRVHDDQHAENLACSGRQRACGIGDDWQVVVDGDPPAPVVGSPQVAGIAPAGAVAVQWPLQAQDSTFYGWRLGVARSADAEPARWWTRAELSALRPPEAVGATLPRLDWPGDSLWLVLQAEDLGGNLGEPSARGGFLYADGSWCQATIVEALLDGPWLRLAWESDCAFEGAAPAGWWLHRLETPWQAPDESTRWRWCAAPETALDWAADGLGLGAFFRVTVEMELPPAP